MSQWYRQAQAKALNKEINFLSDSIVATLHTSTYVPNLDTHAYVSDLTNELAAGAGYTAGGVALGGKTSAYTAANSWTVAWAASTAYTVGAVVRPSTGNGFLYRCSVAGTSAAAEPAWPTVIGQTVTDGTVTWTCVAKGIVKLSYSAVSWASATFTARYMVLSDRTPATAATQPLLALADFGVDKTGGGGAFTVTPDANQGDLHILVP